MPDSPDQNPDVGPRPFEANATDRARFFGRERETNEIVSLIRGHPVVLAYAQSGAGKTSLFNVRVAPALQGNGFNVLPLARVLGAAPEGVDPASVTNLYIFNALLHLDPEAEPESLMSTTLADFLAARPRGTDDEGHLVPRALIFDQFEELFTLITDRGSAAQFAFFDQVAAALAADPLLRVVFVIREDYLAQLDPFARQLPERLRTRFRLERLREPAALEAVQGPLVDADRTFAPGVAERLVQELLQVRAVSAGGEAVAVTGPYVEPVQLQVVCVTLWSSLPAATTVIDEGHLRDFGDVDRALRTFYRDALGAATGASSVDEPTLRRWFGSTLITTMGTRGTVYRDEESTGGISNAAIDVLEGQHLIRAEYRAGTRWYELSHDRCIGPILADNEAWDSKRRAGATHPLARPAREWQRLGSDEDALLRGKRLAEATAWSAAHPAELDELERSFLDASQALKEREQVARRRLRRRIASLVVGLAIGLVLTGLAAWQWQDADRARSDAQRAVGVAEAAQAQAEVLRMGAEQAEDAAKALLVLEVDEGRSCAPTLLSPSRGDVLDNGRRDRTDGIIWRFSWSLCAQAVRYRLVVQSATASFPVVMEEALFNGEEVSEDPVYVFDSPDGFIINERRMGWTWEVTAIFERDVEGPPATGTFDVEPLDTDPPG